ncbi:MAG: hypothetical protein QT11_C0001G0472 [archaeon GW2011_AR20]|nr:MAG: hypothetical protein QT11_C0001G0472 [archaeon GW2011_AR20]AQS28143.1 hypothetical protein [uncultured archaeon]AQS28743.1 hypothetical protein [uncultured archaeon]MBS3160560.1 hypothetical protein [Candidatus Woesearchaeota archaeon]
MDIKINVAFRNLKHWQDSEKRSEHVFDRMKERAIGKEQIKEAVLKGAKTIRADKSILATYRWYAVAYREFRIKDVRKIYPITVMEV